ncbi:LysR family transcriptional regulator [Yoonia litorea]|uniref:DNA-binding transcriptional regulator, LysR family n=1 Tax=Yoonia litorea TaxID=1123755 RepID=A0A1I6N2S5_9RHOB|nr:LysR family transcriptional regulator [Yoonia litorea]SFS22236.1 DNA-binding transcriptional regulator, LysR family [Yoonia litorea]
MQIDLIDTFLDLCKTKSFNQTADRLGITQSTVSSRIKSLEGSVGAALFKRSRSGTELTTAGLRFEPHARGLRHSWSVARNATRDATLGGVTMRIGLQHDLVSPEIRTLIQELRETFSQTAFLFEADYSGQMCADLVSGVQDIALLYTPQMQPDLHFETVGEVSYVMVSTECATIQDVKQDRYILGNYAPAFSQAHASLLPELSAVSLSIGQNAAMVALLTSLSGTAYVLENSAVPMIKAGQCHRVIGAPVISQPVYIGLNMRNRHRTSFRRLVSILKAQFSPVS